MSDHQREIEEFGNNDDFWLFGYGSLIWKPPPHYDQRVPGYIENYVRRFWQVPPQPHHINIHTNPTNSEDHRGTPAAPGRVVTLIDKAHWDTLTDHHESTERVWGAAYHIPSTHVAAVRSYLDLREINGYSIQFTSFQPAPSVSDPQPSTIKCLVYIGLPENPQFLGPQQPDALARKILESRGPSGENREYLYELERALAGLGQGSGDSHVKDLAGRCREIEGREGEANREGVVDGAEEVEK
ncbi:ChaC-like protein [Ophiobolus disseminans]|uniref:glutathione-specific gamma-glutamylcyclotransferase n=1 Tax=Ophiobolus disseminans TaxID=1469910 RepID=A0A6A7AEI9_9PLEO|nr:ChaC-like protein [Ophiobolus disseminans]